jgi:hypothetical protein
LDTNSVKLECHDSLYPILSLYKKVYDSGMSDPLIFGFPEQWERFKNEHPAFLERWRNLQDLMHGTFARILMADGPEDRVIFILGRCCTEDFFELLLLAGNGYGFGAQKLLRGLYERAVTTAHLIQHPEDVETYLNYHHVAQHKLLGRVLEIHGPDAVSEDRRTETERLYEEVKADYMISACKACGTTRMNHTWNKLDVVSMAKNAGWPWKHLIEGYQLPMSFTHSTVRSMLARIAETPEGGLGINPELQPNEADDALRTAHLLLLYVIQDQCKHFKLTEIDQLRETCKADYSAVWPRAPKSDGT